jgi:hypothetical protein
LYELLLSIQRGESDLFKKWIYIVDWPKNYFFICIHYFKFKTCE